MTEVVATDGNGSPILRALHAVERLSAVDAVAGLAATSTKAVLSGGVGDVLRGSWLGHPLHPVIVTIPIGTWSAAPLFDVAGQPLAAQRLIQIGLAAAIPAAVSGLAEYTTLDVPQRRVALVHAASNTVAMSALAASLVAPRNGRRFAALGWTVAGVSVAGVSGALGGHLSYVQSAGVQREAVPEVMDSQTLPGGS